MKRPSKIARDITSRKATEDALRSANDALRSANEALSNASEEAHRVRIDAETGLAYVQAGATNAAVRAAAEAEGSSRRPVTESSPPAAEADPSPQSLGSASPSRLAARSSRLAACSSQLAARSRPRSADWSLHDRKRSLLFLLRPDPGPRRARPPAIDLTSCLRLLTAHTEVHSATHACGEARETRCLLPCSTVVTRRAEEFLSVVCEFPESSYTRRRRASEGESMGILGNSQRDAGSLEGIEVGL